MIQAYFLENCVRKFENSKVRKFSGFLKISISTSAYLGIGVYGDLADSAKVHQLERTFRGTKPPLFMAILTFSGCTRRKVWPTGLLDSETARPQARSREKKSGTTGSKFQTHFYDWGRPGSCSAASAGPEKWSEISLNSKIEWKSGLQSYAVLGRISL